jgi:UDP-N-acetylmuramoyl-L-alanyl-D-glutamate--2,6-diaminopimelate ligase
MNPKKLARKVAPKAGIRTIETAYRKSRGAALQVRYGFPARGMRVIAVTGTNGKSTTCSYINEVLKAGGFRTAVLSTVFYEINGIQEPNLTHYTIGKQSIVQSFFAKARKAKVDWVILEVTSHAIDQARIMGIPVEIAVITNLTQDHLDYHGTMQEYARVKSLLLRDYGASHAVLNADDDWFEYFKKRSKAEVFSIGKKSGVTGQLKAIKLSNKGASATFSTKPAELSLKTNLVGEFNLYNAAVAAAIGCILQISYEQIEAGVSNLKAVAGRMEPVEAGQDFQVLVDFAITPDALEQALSSLQKVATGKVRVVFGGTGDRDKGKRPLMGVVAAEHADAVYLTDDETYTEDPDVIRDAVYQGIKQAKAEDKTKVIPDRRAAIRQAFKDAGAGDIVLLTGLGHEDSRNMGGKLIPWNEHQVALEELSRR